MQNDCALKCLVVFLIQGGLLSFTYYAHCQTRYVTCYLSDTCTKTKGVKKRRAKKPLNWSQSKHTRISQEERKVCPSDLMVMCILIEFLKVS